VKTKEENLKQSKHTHNTPQDYCFFFVGFHYFFLTKPLYIENKLAFFVVSGNKPKKNKCVFCVDLFYWQFWNDNQLAF
jgi:hypothetical protein